MNLKKIKKVFNYRWESNPLLSDYKSDALAKWATMKLSYDYQICTGRGTWTHMLPITLSAAYKAEGICQQINLENI